MAGILYGWIGVYYGEMARMVDTWAFHYESVKETRLLLSDPAAFFGGIFHNTYNEGYTKFLAVESSWWNDLKGTIFAKLLAILNVASFSQYYTNVIFYAYISLIGPVAIYRVMKDVFTENRLAIFLATFLVPSFLYWTSGLHKDGLIFLGIATVVYCLYFGLKEKHFSVFRILAIILGLLVVLALRNFLIIPLLPAVLAWLLASRFKKKPWLVFTAIYAFFIVLFFTARFLHPRLNFPEEVVSRQEAFLGLGGNSAVEVNRLKPTVGSFIVNIPQAFSLAAIRPYPTDVHHLLSLAAAAEINFLLLVVLACLVFRKKGYPSTPVLLFCFFFGFSVLLMIGYSVNILGAIVRYRSIVLTLVLVPVFAQVDWKRLGRLLSGNGNIDDK